MRLARGPRSRLGAVDVDLGVCPRRRRGCLIPLEDDEESLAEFGEELFSSGLMIHHDDFPVPSL